MSSLRPERIGLDDFADQPVSVCGKSFRAHMSGALYWPSQNALILSDLQLLRSSSMAANSPSRSHSDPGETLRALAGLIDSYDATTIIALGDGAQNRSVAGDMTASDRETLNIIQEDREWIWVAPKMDRTAQSRFGGTLAPELTVEGIRLCHQPRLGAITHEVAGALHPAARLVMNGTAIRRPCFVSNGLRLIVPAFSAFSGGLNILDAAFDPLFGGDVMAVWMLGQDGLYPVAPRQLCED